MKKWQKANHRKIFFLWEQTIKDKRCQSSPCMLLLGGLSCSPRVTSVPLGSVVPTHPMAPVSCTGYECQTSSHMVRENMFLPLLSFKQHAYRQGWVRLLWNVGSYWKHIKKHEDSIIEITKIIHKNFQCKAKYLKAQNIFQCLIAQFSPVKVAVIGFSLKNLV